jgi:uncharacterized membrane protein
MNSRKNTTKILVISAMFAALTCVATMIIKVPSPLNGYVNLGDSIVLLAGGIIAELAMVGGYLLFESFLYGFVPSLANIPANCVQGIVCLVIALVAIRFVKRNPDSFRL